jgi:two-component system response regulator NreC
VELNELDGTKIDLAIVDLVLSDGGSLNWIGNWCCNHPGRKAIILTAREEDAVMYRVFRTSVAGIVHKRDGLDFLEMAVKSVLAGGSFMSPRIQSIRTKMNTNPLLFVKILSEREQEILRLMGEGFKAEEIARQLSLKVATIIDHRKNIMNKLDLHSQAELVAYSLRKGLADINGEWRKEKAS